MRGGLHADGRERRCRAARGSRTLRDHPGCGFVITRGWFVLGPELAAFEPEFAAACGAAEAVGVGTGTDALAIALRALGIGPGDEVITSPLSAAFLSCSNFDICVAGSALLAPSFDEVDWDCFSLQLTSETPNMRHATILTTSGILPPKSNISHKQQRTWSLLSKQSIVYFGKMKRACLSALTYCR